GRVIQETCHWDEGRKETIPLRGKEGSSDYRYFPEPDLLPLTLETSFMEELAARLPELPYQRRLRLQEQYNLEPKEAELLTVSRQLADFFEEAALNYSDHRNLFNWVQGDLLFQLRDSGKPVHEFKPMLLVELLTLLDNGDINRPVAKELLTEMVQSGTSPQELLKGRRLGRIAGRSTLEPLVQKVIDENQDAVASFRQGKDKALAFLVGKVMAVTGGRADPGEVNKILREKIG
ncbi:MAG TPA: hypothetical protein VLH18_01580, partial [Candidatus Limnocylindrales bacterium]|nr:hypothetical protein [Candidatus Limnocylindrales bacterium]